MWLTGAVVYLHAAAQIHLPVSAKTGLDVCTMCCKVILSTLYLLRDMIHVKIIIKYPDL